MLSALLCVNLLENSVCGVVCELIRNAVCEPNGNSLCDTVYDPIII